MTGAGQRLSPPMWGDLSPTSSSDRLPGATRYMERVQQLLHALAQTQTAAIDAAATAITQALHNGGQLYLFGTGHSHMLAEEGLIPADVSDPELRSLREAVAELRQAVR